MKAIGSFWPGWLCLFVCLYFRFVFIYSSCQFSSRRLFVLKKSNKQSKIPDKASVIYQSINFRTLIRLAFTLNLSIFRFFLSRFFKFFFNLSSARLFGSWSARSFLASLRSCRTLATDRRTLSYAAKNGAEPTLVLINSITSETSSLNCAVVWPHLNMLTFVRKRTHEHVSSYD